METGGGVNILLVDDNPADVLLFREAIKECTKSCSIRVAQDGEEAKKVLFGRPSGSSLLPDLIVLDLNLPKVTGDELLRLIKADSALRTIPVVILSTSSNAEDIRRSYENQATCYLVKPSNLGDYMRMVQDWGNFWMSMAVLPPRAQAFRV